MTLWLVVVWLGCGCGGAAMAVEAAQDRNVLMFLLAMLAMAVGVFAGLAVLS